MPKVSIIIPVYNVEKYLAKCLDSVVNQTLTDIEIIVVNDGTPDNSQQLIDEYRKKYPNLIKAYIKKNGGLSDARNYGLKKASGEYISFIDSDDYVDLTMYETMYDKAIESSADLVVCNLNFVYDEKKVPVSSNILNDTTDIKSIMTDIYPSAWAKLYKKSLIEEYKFKKGVWFEDVEFIYRLLPKVTKIATVDTSFYQYVQRQGAITSTYDERLYHYIDNWNGIISYYKNNNLFNKYYAELEYSYVRYIYGTFIKRAMKYPKKEQFYQALNTAVTNVKTNFPKYRFHSYFNRSLKGLYLSIFNKPMLKIGYILRRII